MSRRSNKTVMTPTANADDEEYPKKLKKREALTTHFSFLYVFVSHDFFRMTSVCLEHVSHLLYIPHIGLSHKYDASFSATATTRTIPLLVCVFVIKWSRNILYSYALMQLTFGRPIARCVERTNNNLGNGEGNPTRGVPSNRWHRCSFSRHPRGCCCSRCVVVILVPWPFPLDGTPQEEAQEKWWPVREGMVFGMHYTEPFGSTSNCRPPSGSRQRRMKHSLRTMVRF